jgi:hypothetical protein
VTPERRARRRARLRVVARIGARVGAWLAEGVAIAHPRDFETQRRAREAGLALDDLAHHLDEPTEAAR